MSPLQCTPEMELGTILTATEIWLKGSMLQPYCCLSPPPICLPSHSPSPPLTLTSCATPPQASVQKAKKDVPTIIIFIVGGMTYSEIRAIYEVSSACSTHEFIIGKPHQTALRHWLVVLYCGISLLWICIQLWMWFTNTFSLNAGSTHIITPTEFINQLKVLNPLTDLWHVWRVQRVCFIPFNVVTIVHRVLMLIEIVVTSCSFSYALPKFILVCLLQL